MTLLDIEDANNSFDHYIITWVSLFVSMCSVSINIDHGGIPALTKPLKAELEIGNQGLGMLGSLVFFGLVLGSISATFLFDRM